MKIRMTGDGRVFQGTPKQIVEEMKYIAFGQEHRTLGEYIDWAVGELERLQSIALDVRGDSDEEKAESLVRGMIGAGLAARM